MFLDLYPVLLDFDFEVDILLESSVDLVWSELCQSFFEEMDFKFDVEVFFLECVDMLPSSEEPSGTTTSGKSERTWLAELTCRKTTR